VRQHMGTKKNHEIIIKKSNKKMWTKEMVVHPDRFTKENGTLPGRSSYDRKKHTTTKTGGEESRSWN